MLIQSKRETQRLDTETSQNFVQDYVKNPYNNIEAIAPKNNARNVSINLDLRNKVDDQRKRSDSHVSLKSLNTMQKSLQKDLNDKQSKMLRRNIMVHLRQQQLIDKGRKSREQPRSMCSDELSVKPKSAANIPGGANRVRVSMKQIYSVQQNQARAQF